MKGNRDIFYLYVGPYYLIHMLNIFGLQNVFKFSPSEDVKRSKLTKGYFKTMWSERVLAANLETKKAGQITISMKE